MSAGSARADCSAVQGTTRQLLSEQALVTNGQIYGAVRLLETKLLPSLPTDDSRHWTIAINQNAIYNAISVPAEGCTDDPTMQHLDLVAILELRPKRHQPTVDLGANAMVTEIRMHRICEIDRSRAARQRINVALRRKTKHLVRKHFEPRMLEKLLGTGCTFKDIK